MTFLGQALFGCNVSAFFDDGAFHQEHQKGEHDPDHGKDQEGVEISEGRGLMLAQIFQAATPTRCIIRYNGALLCRQNQGCLCVTTIRHPAASIMRGKLRLRNSV